MLQNGDFSIAKVGKVSHRGLKRGKAEREDSHGGAEGTEFGKGEWD
jgi:hypothetical protein